MIRKIVIIVAAALALALPASAQAANPYNYFGGGMYPGGFANDYTHWRTFANTIFPSGVHFNSKVTYSSGCSNQLVISASSPISISTCPYYDSYASCYRYTNNPGGYPDGGTGYRSPVYCRTDIT